MKTIIPFFLANILIIQVRTRLFKSSTSLFSITFAVAKNDAWGNQKSVAYLSGLNHKEKLIPFFFSSSVAGPIFSRSYSIDQREKTNKTSQNEHVSYLDIQVPYLVTQYQNHQTLHLELNVWGSAKTTILLNNQRYTSKEERKRGAIWMLELFYITTVNLFVCCSFESRTIR